MTRCLLCPLRPGRVRDCGLPVQPAVCAGAAAAQQLQGGHAAACCRGWEGGAGRNQAGRRGRACAAKHAQRAAHLHFQVLNRSRGRWQLRRVVLLDELLCSRALLCSCSSGSGGCLASPLLLCCAGAAGAGHCWQRQRRRRRHPGRPQGMHGPGGVRNDSDHGADGTGEPAEHASRAERAGAVCHRSCRPQLVAQSQAYLSPVSTCARPASALRPALGPRLLCAAPPLLHPRGPAACAAAATANALFTCPLLSVLSSPCIFPSSAHTHTNTTTTTTSSIPPHPHPTRQNTEGVAGVHVAPTPFIRQQIQAVLSDIGADCVKTGMLPTPEASVPLPRPAPASWLRWRKVHAGRGA